eukprot:TRINITY_DN8230_c0_g1_i2.p1 TRINITY_DN8230_c0_g1~~TRINITY_DN8230_c0_g1_i2.p1  ORF type:complete len:716 (+),score=133.91 TRINITY_DN8230_c0_g1_i2:101-2248(+)
MTTPKTKTKTTSEENISVSVRLRPLLKKETRQGTAAVWDTEEEAGTIRSILQSNTNGYSTLQRNVDYSFDQVFGPDVQNHTLYETVAESIVWSSMEGFNGTIFAYGQTASGKTYTMKGTRNNPGIIPLAIQDVFSYIKQTPEREFLLRVSYMEIYNEIINDLLSPQNTNLKIHENTEDGVYVAKLKEEIVLSPGQVMSIIAAGEAHRHVGATNFNEMSSRSHTIFRMVIESKPLSARGGPVRVSTLNLIDLAGSERACPSGKGLRTLEGGFINKSLLTLSTVISRLSEDKGEHIPYRDSKLTRILSSSLSGNARIGIICTLSPTPASFEETHNTLKFAHRAKAITNRAKLNEVLDDKALIKKYRTKITQLLKRLQEVKEMEQELQKLQQAEVDKKNLEQSNATLVKRLVEQEAVRVSLEEKINRLTKLILVSSSIATPQAKMRHWSGRPSATPSSSLLRITPSPMRSMNGSAVSTPRANVRRNLNHYYSESNGASSGSESEEDGSAETFRVFKERKPRKDGVMSPDGTGVSYNGLSPDSKTGANGNNSGNTAAVEALRVKIAGLEEENGLMRLDAAYLNQQIKDLRRDLGAKDIQMLSLMQQMKEKDDMVDTLTRGGKSGDLEILTGVVAAMHENQIRRLKEQILDGQIEREALRADHVHLMSSLDEKEEIIHEWAEVFEHFEEKQVHLEEELAKLKAKRRGVIPHSYSDTNALY